VSNVLNEEKKQQVIALGRLGWSLRRIQKNTGVRRETAASYLKSAKIAFRPPGGWGRQSPAKPANEVITDSAAVKPASGATTDPAPAKPANEVIAELAAGATAVPDPPPGRSPSASACWPYREVIELGLSRGRNAMAIWQDLVDTCSFAAGYQSVRRFVSKLHPSQSPQACAVIKTAPGEDYGESRVMVRGVANPSRLAGNLSRGLGLYVT
jgi:hypothetical protein